MFDTNPSRVIGWQTTGMVDPRTGAPPTADGLQDLWSSQGEQCGVCHEELCDRTRGGRRIVVDHDHRTGLVRGLICQRCNVLLERKPKDPQMAHMVQQYLSDWPAMRGIEGGKMPLFPYTASVSAKNKGGYATSANSRGIYAVAPKIRVDEPRAGQTAADKRRERFLGRNTHK